MCNKCALQKCTYGNKCKFRHPERGPHPHKSVTERLVEHAQRHLQARSPSLSLPLSADRQQGHQSLSKTKSWAAGALPSSPPDSSSCAAVKSSSVENVTVAAHNAAQGTISPFYKYAHFPHTFSLKLTRLFNSIVHLLSGYTSSLGWVAPRVPNPEPESANMHRKLQRQLTLNPSYDPRLNQLRRYHQHQHHHQQQQQQQLHQQAIASPAHSAMQNRQLTRHASNDAVSYPVSMRYIVPKNVYVNDSVSI